MNNYSLLLILWAGHFLVDFMIAIFPLYKTMAKIDLATAGAIASLSAFIGEMTQLFFGVWSDRGYRKWLIAAGILLATASIGVIYCESALLMFPLIMMTYIGSGAFHPSAAGLAGSLSRSRKALFITFFACGGSFGLAAGQLIFYHAYLFLGSSVFLIALPSLLLIACMAFMKFPEVSQNTPRVSMSVGRMVQLFRQEDLRILYVVLVCNTTVFFGFMFLLPDFLVWRGYPEWICYGGGHLAAILGAACMMVPSGYLADRFSARVVIFSSMVLGLFCLYAFLATPLLSPFLLMVLLFCLGALLGVVHPIGVALANRFLPSYPGLASAFSMGMVWCLAESLGPATCFLTRLFPENVATINALFILGTLNIVGLVYAFKLPSHEIKEIVLESR